MYELSNVALDDPLSNNQLYIIVIGRAHGEEKKKNIGSKKGWGSTQISDICYFKKPDLHPEHFFKIKSSRSDNLQPGRLQTLKFSGIFLLFCTTLSFEGMMKLGLNSPD